MRSIIKRWAEFYHDIFDIDETFERFNPSEKINKGDFLSVINYDISIESIVSAIEEYDFEIISSIDIKEIQDESDPREFSLEIDPDSFKVITVSGYILGVGGYINKGSMISIRECLITWLFYFWLTGRHPAVDCDIICASTKDKKGNFIVCKISEDGTKIHIGSTEGYKKPSEFYHLPARLVVS